MSSVFSDLRLPDEVWILIVENIDDKETLRSLSLTDKVLRSLGQARLFRTVRLQRSKERTESLIECLCNESSRLGRHIRNLKISVYAMVPDEHVRALSSSSPGSGTTPVHFDADFSTWSTQLESASRRLLSICAPSLRTLRLHAGNSAFRYLDTCCREKLNDEFCSTVALPILKKYEFTNMRRLEITARYLTYLRQILIPQKEEDKGFTSNMKRVRLLDISAEPDDSDCATLQNSATFAKSVSPSAFELSCRFGIVPLSVFSADTWLSHTLSDLKLTHVIIADSLSNLLSSTPSLKTLNLKRVNIDGSVDTWESVFTILNSYTFLLSVRLCYLRYWRKVDNWQRCRGPSLSEKGNIAEGSGPVFMRSGGYYPRPYASMRHAVCSAMRWPIIVPGDNNARRSALDDLRREKEAFRKLFDLLEKRGGMAIVPGGEMDRAAWIYCDHSGEFMDSIGGDKAADATSEQFAEHGPFL